MAKIIPFPDRKTLSEVKKIRTSKKNDKVFTQGKTRFFSSVFFAVRYVLALMLFFVVGLPLAVLHGFGFLIKIIGSIVMIGVTGFYFYHGDVSGWAVLGGWLLVGFTGLAQDLMNWWVSSGIPFKIFRVENQE